MKTGAVLIGSLNPAHTPINKRFSERPLLTPLSPFSTESLTATVPADVTMGRKTGERFGGKDMDLMFLELYWIQGKKT